MSKQDQIDELVRRSLMYDRLKEMGMIGSGGILSNKEACRRNSWIRNKQKELGVDSRELNRLKIEAAEKGEIH